MSEDLGLPAGWKLSAKTPDQSSGDVGLPAGWKLAEPQKTSRSLLDAISGYESGFASGLADKELPPDQGMAAKVGHFMGSAGPVAVGAGLGAVGGPMGMALGGGLGKLAQKTMAAGLGAAERVGGVPEAEQRFQSKESPIQSAGDIAISGAIQGTIGSGMQLGGALLNTPVAKAIGKKLASGGGQILRILTNVRPSEGTAAVSNLEKFANAPSQEAVSEAYRSFYDRLSAALGRTVKGRRELVAESADPFETVGRSMKDMRKAANDLKSGKLDVQGAIDASQAARKIRDMKMRGNEFAQEVADTADELKGQFDDFIDANVPAQLKGEWARIREMNFWKEVRDSFNSALPQNVNTFPNALRGNLGMAGGAVAGALGGGPLGAAIGAGVGLAAQSPALYGLGLQGAYYGLRAGQAIVPPAIRGAVEQSKTIPDVTDFYNRRKAP